MARTKSRSRARAHARPSRHAALSKRSTSSTAKSGDSWAKYILPAAAVGIVAYLLWPKGSDAAERKAEPNVDPNKNKVDPNRPPPPRKFPAGAILATVQSPGPFPAGTAPGMRLRASPSLTAAIVHAGIPNGTDVQLLQKDIPEQGVPDTPGKNRWAEVRTLEGVQGFLRAIGPGGEANIVIRSEPNTGAFAAFHPQQLRLHPLPLTHPHPVRHHRVPGWRGW